MRKARGDGINDDVTASGLDETPLLLAVNPRTNNRVREHTRSSAPLLPAAYRAKRTLNYHHRADYPLLLFTSCSTRMISQKGLPKKTERPNPFIPSAGIPLIHFAVLVTTHTYDHLPSSAHAIWFARTQRPNYSCRKRPSVESTKNSHDLFLG